VEAERLTGLPPNEQYLSLVPNNLTNPSEGNPGSDLRAVQDHVENEIIVLEVGAKGAITDLGEDTMGKVDTDYTLDFPHQVSADAESPDLAAYCRVNRFIKIISGTKPNIRIEPVIVF
jgi:hypothetical protein